MILLCIHSKEPYYSMLYKATEGHASWVSPGKWGPLHLFSYGADPMSQRWIHLAYPAGKQSKSYFLLKINHKTTKQASFSLNWSETFLGNPSSSTTRAWVLCWQPWWQRRICFSTPLGMRGWKSKYQTCLLTRTPVGLVSPKGQKQHLEVLLPTLDLIRILPRLGLAQKRIWKGRSFERVIMSHYISSPNAGSQSPGKQGTEFEGSESPRMSELMA